MPTLYEYNNTLDDAAQAQFGARWNAQTFTPATSHTIISVKLKLYRAFFPGTVTVSIRATDVNGKPTGADLAVGTTDGNTLDISPNYEWREISLGNGTYLIAGTLYAIVVRAVNGVPGKQLHWRIIAGSSYDVYVNGRFAQSLDSGVSWAFGDTKVDFMFEDWGGTAGSTYHVYPTDPTIRVSSIVHRYGRGVYNMEMKFGDVTADFNVPEIDLIPKKSFEDEEEKKAKQQPVTIVVSPGTPTPQVTPPSPTQPPKKKEQVVTGPIQLTQYAKDVLKKHAPTAEALQARITGLQQGVQAVVTPYAIDVIRKNEEAAALLASIQAWTKQASMTTIRTEDRARLLKQIVSARARLKTLYGK